MRLLRRCADALVLLIVASNAWHVANAAARLLSKRVDLRTAKNFDARALFAELDSGASRDITHGL